MQAMRLYIARPMSDEWLLLFRGIEDVKVVKEVHILLCIIMCK